MRVIGWFGLAITLAAGCGESTWELTRSGVPAGGDAGADGGTCTARCVPEYPVDETDDRKWELVPLWHGPEGEAPYCESALDGHIGLMVSNDCPACACEPSVGTCKSPETITVHSEACGHPGSTDMSFDPPPDWDGTCNGDAAIPADCGGVPCARSVTIGLMAIVDESCIPAAQPIPRAAPSPPTWDEFARGCNVASQTELNPALGKCGNYANCLPEVTPFRYCYRHAGDVKCMGNEYTDRFVVYGGYDDHRTCTDCTCGPPQGSVCKGAASVYSDSTCSQFEGGCMVDSSNSCCVDLLPGTALGSKDITQPTYTPGACEAVGGTVEGSVERTDPRTYCCLPPDK